MDKIQDSVTLSSNELAEVTAIQDFIEEGIIDNPLLYEKDLMEFLREEDE